MRPDWRWLIGVALAGVIGGLTYDLLKNKSFPAWEELLREWGVVRK